MNLQVDNIPWILLGLTTILTAMEILYFLLSNREVKKMHSFLGGDHKIIRMQEGIRSSFNPADYQKLQTLREKGILRDCWKWILKFQIINTTQMRTSYFWETSSNDLSWVMIRSLDSKFKLESSRARNARSRAAISTLHNQILKDKTKNTKYWIKVTKKKKVKIELNIMSIRKLIMPKKMKFREMIFS